MIDCNFPTLSRIRMTVWNITISTSWSAHREPPDARYPASGGLQHCKIRQSAKLFHIQNKLPRRVVGHPDLHMDYPLQPNGGEGLYR